MRSLRGTFRLLLPLAAVIAFAHPAAAETTAPAASPAPVSLEDLASMSGGKEPAAINALTSGVATGNSITGGATSGNISVDSNSLNFNGIGNFVFNTGQNNVLQGVLNVYVAIVPNVATP
jgi:hypothetical protein